MSQALLRPHASIPIRVTRKTTPPPRPLPHADHAERLQRLRVEVLDAFERSKARIEARLADLVEDVQQRQRDPRRHAQLAALASQSQDLIEEARTHRIRPGAKGLARWEDLVSDLVDAALVHGD